MDIRWILRWWRIWSAAVLTLFGCRHPVSAQQANEQLWIDYLVDLPFARVYMYETEISYQTLLSREGKWRSLNVTPSLERNINQHLDLLLGVPLSYTVQKADFNTVEARLMLGTRLYFTPRNRVQTRLTLRWERRFFRDLEVGVWENSNRTRARGEIIFPINRPSYSTDDVWYALGDFEYFFILDQDVRERFANRSRTRIGLGYRKSYFWRFEVIYTFQQSRNKIEDAFTSFDNIFRLRIKHYLPMPATRKPGFDPPLGGGTGN
jgi:hypothetical protein